MSPLILPDVGDLKATFAPQRLLWQKSPTLSSTTGVTVAAKTLPGPGQPEDIYTQGRKGPTGDANLAKGTPK